MTTYVEQLDWHGCYDDSWKGFIVPEAFAHPAKFSRGLITRIFRYMLDEGMLAKGSTVVDPFGGIGTGGIVAAGMGYRWYGCELEKKFYDLGNANFALHGETWRQFGDPLPVLVNGDSRKLRENLRGVLADCCVSSPPFHQSGVTDHEGQTAALIGKFKGGGDKFLSNYNYGSAPGQLGAMKPGDVNAVISSPPFLGARSGTTASSPPAAGGPCAERINTVADGDRYGDTEGQLSAMAVGDVDAVVGSPPYSERHAYADEARNEARAEKLKANGQIGGTRGLHKPAGEHPDNLAQLPQGDVDSIVTSPPYEGNRFDGGKESLKERQGFSEGYSAEGGYGDNSDGQLGNEQGETFWHAARDIVAECYAILKPGGWSAWVCKDFVRNKARVPFCDDWCKLLESQDFVVTTRVHAMLVKETREPDLFGGDDHVTTTERKSFFRRLAEKKGSPRIDYEEVIFAMKQET